MYLVSRIQTENVRLVYICYDPCIENACSICNQKYTWGFSFCPADRVWFHVHYVLWSMVDCDVTRRKHSMDTNFHFPAVQNVSNYEPRVRIFVQWFALGKQDYGDEPQAQPFALAFSFLMVFPNVLWLVWWHRDALHNTTGMHFQSITTQLLGNNKCIYDSDFVRGFVFDLQELNLNFLCIVQNTCRPKRHWSYACLTTVDRQIHQ